MAVGKKAEFFVPYEQLQALLDDLGDAVKGKTLKKGMERIADLYEAEMIKLAPVKTGYLEGSTVVRVWKRATKIIAQIKFGADYAAEVHEMPPDRRGARTRRKPATQFGNPGPKYVERVLKGMDFRFHMREILTKILKEKGKVK